VAQERSRDVKSKRETQPATKEAGGKIIKAVVDDLAEIIVYGDSEVRTESILNLSIDSSNSCARR